MGLPVKLRHPAPVPAGHTAGQGRVDLGIGLGLVLDDLTDRD